MPVTLSQLVPIAADAIISRNRYPYTVHPPVADATGRYIRCTISDMNSYTYSQMTWTSQQEWELGRGDRNALINFATALVEHAIRNLNAHINQVAVPAGALTPAGLAQEKEEEVEDVIFD